MKKIGRRFGLFRRNLVGIVLGSSVALAAGCAGEPEIPADLVLRNGVVVTVDEANPEGDPQDDRGRDT